MHIKDIFTGVESFSLTKKPVLENHARQLIKLQIPAGQSLKPHVSKVDALLMVAEGSAIFTLWEGEIPAEFEINTHDVVAFKADQLHSVEAKTNFSAFVIK